MVRKRPKVKKSDRAVQARQFLDTLREQKSVQEAVASLNDGIAQCFDGQKLSEEDLARAVTLGLVVAAVGFDDFCRETFRLTFYVEVAARGRLLSKAIFRR